MKLLSYVKVGEGPWWKIEEIWLNGFKSDDLWTEIDAVAGWGIRYISNKCITTELVHGVFKIIETVSPT